MIAIVTDLRHGQNPGFLFCRPESSGQALEGTGQVFASYEYVWLETIAIWEDEKDT